MMHSGLQPDGFEDGKTPAEEKLLRRIEVVNCKRLTLVDESYACHMAGDFQGAVRKRKAAEEARRYLNLLVAQHKRQFGRKKYRHL